MNRPIDEEISPVRNSYSFLATNRNNKRPILDARQSIDSMMNTRTRFGYNEEDEVSLTSSIASLKVNKKVKKRKKKSPKKSIE